MSSLLSSRWRFVCKSLKVAVDFQASNTVGYTLGGKPVGSAALVVPCDVVKYAGGCGNEAQVRTAGVQDSREVLGMELHADEPRVVLDLDNLHAHALLVLADKVETALLQLVDVAGVDFVPVPVALEDLV